MDLELFVFFDQRGPPGDLYVYLDIEEIPEIQRDGINLCSSVSISYLDAILGTTVKVKTVEGTTDLQIPSGMLFRLYTSYICPYAQHVWIARNYKAGLQEKIKLVPIDLQNRLDWYKEKVYPPNKYYNLERNLTFYMNHNVTRTDFDYLESALFKFTDRSFFLGQFSLVDIAYAPFIKRFYPLLLDVKKYDITTGRPMLTSWIEVFEWELIKLNMRTDILMK
ncbi:hypothetical protein HYC85_025756 [Camellia sinensis]|uniref:GST N-terminal domain-containing protein n=1 Tax=Camellia sinensis TaxID=4442 RepID=A0A7J7GC20_CAMSI|nr:hypothetical protein HYC85_025756 [Camellia sinensis]